MINSEKRCNTWSLNNKQYHNWNYLQGSNGDTDLENKLTDTGAGGGMGGGMYEESDMEAYVTIYKIDSQWEFAVWLRELISGLCNNLEGSDGDGGSRGKGTCVYLGFPGSSVSLTACSAGHPVQPLGQEDALEKEMATRSSILAWRAPWTEEPGGLQSVASQESDTT